MNPSVGAVRPYSQFFEPARMDAESAGGLFLPKAEVQTPLQDVVSDSRVYV